MNTTARPATTAIREGLRVIRKYFLSFILTMVVSLAFAQELKFRINYISVDNVFIEAGTNNGIQVGNRLTVKDNGKVIAELEVVYVARSSASCRIIKKERALQIGDYAFADSIFIPDTSVSAPPVRRSRDIKMPEKQKRKIPLTRVSGSLSLQWYQFNDLSSSKLDFRQPTLRFSLRGRRLWGLDYNLRIRFRSNYNQRERRYNSNVPANEWRNRLYEFSLSYDREDAPFQYRIGRIISGQFSGVGYIDGLSLQYNAAKSFSMGLFAGTQPEWQYSGFQTSIQKYGLYARYKHGTYEGQRFESTLSAVGAYHGSTISREFVYWQSTYSLGRILSLYQNLEIDYNQGWRQNKTGESLSLTGVYF